MKILFETVGGSDEPLVTAIKKIKPDHVYFICSNGKASSEKMVNGEGKVCGKPEQENHNKTEARSNIMKQTKLTDDKVTIVKVDPDNPVETHDKVLEKMHQHQYEGRDCYVNYTGGTKSMAAGLYNAGTEIQDSNIVLIKGDRFNLVQVSGKHSVTNFFTENEILGKRQLKHVFSLVHSKNYKAALSLIDDLYMMRGFGTTDKFKSILDVIYSFVDAFNEWDNFQYAQARESLLSYLDKASPAAKKKIVPYKKCLDKLKDGIASYKEHDQETVKYKNQRLDEFLVVYDLIRNAERKAEKKNYDDAVSRIYRATEMYAQVTLKLLNFDSSNVDIDRLRNLGIEEKRIAYYEKHRSTDRKDQLVQIGLRDNYCLLNDLGHPTGKKWDEIQNEIVNCLTCRNNSMLAHGIRPVSGEDYARLHDVVVEFINRCDEDNNELVKNKQSLKNYPDLPDEIDLME